MDIRFRLRPRRSRSIVDNEYAFTTENVLITMRVSYNSMRLKFSTGFRIDTRYWDQTAERAIGNGSDGTPSEVINNGLEKLAYAVKDTATLFVEKEHAPSQDEFKEAFQRTRSGEIKVDNKNSIPKRGRLRKDDNQDNLKSKLTESGQSRIINNISENKATVKNCTKLTFWDAYHGYEAYAGKLNDWSEMTRKKYETIRFNIKSFRDWKRQNGMPNFDVTFDYLDENGMQSFVDYLRDIKKYVNSTIRKDVVMLKVVIRWAYRKRYHHNNMFEAYRPALKSAPKKVIFFNKKELENFEIPETKLYLIRVRDVFLFQCYTGLRYSDLANLRRCDVHDKYIEITTIKTVDSLRIELMSYASWPDLTSRYVSPITESMSVSTR